MSFERKWRNYQRLTEAKEQTPFKSAAQKRYKRQRRKNDIYSTRAGHKNLSLEAHLRAKYSGLELLVFALKAWKKL